MPKTKPFAVVGFVLATFYGFCWAQNDWHQVQDPEPLAQADQDTPEELDSAHSSEERNEKLAKYLTQTRWTGKFTFTGPEEKPLAEEQYEIIKATKSQEGDYWDLVARIKYGEKDVTLPLPSLEIKWAGETPVITVDKMTIPGMGTFDARVLIRKGQYAGTWAHGKVGGHLFGRIEKIETPSVAPDDKLP
jgi:hypothetical protein